jgi:hypothetical protein
MTATIVRVTPHSERTAPRIHTIRIRPAGLIRRGRPIDGSALELPPSPIRRDCSPACLPNSKNMDAAGQERTQAALMTFLGALLSSYGRKRCSRSQNLRRQENPLRVASVDNVHQDNGANRAAATTPLSRSRSHKRQQHVSRLIWGKFAACMRRHRARGAASSAENRSPTVSGKRETWISGLRSPG